MEEQSAAKIEAEKEKGKRATEEKEKERRKEEERRLEEEMIEKERIEKERMEKERVEKERIEKERQAKEEEEEQRERERERVNAERDRQRERQAKEDEERERGKEERGGEAKEREKVFETLKSLNLSGTEYGRSKIMIIGQFRGGKTSFARAFTGLGYVDTGSTRGIALSRFKREMAADGKSSAWVICEERERELEVTELPFSPSFSPPSSSSPHVANLPSFSPTVGDRTRIRPEEPQKLWDSG